LSRTWFRAGSSLLEITYRHEWARPDPLEDLDQPRRNG
jgi:hypothetical protein